MADVLQQFSSWNSRLEDLGEAEVKHGVRVHLFNLHTEEAGNPEMPQKVRAARSAAAQSKSGAAKKKRSLSMIAASVVLAALVGGFFFATRSAHALSEKDTIVLADFDNSTGDPVFDDTLRQALAVEIEQSPFLNTLSEQKVHDTLQLMGKRKATLTQDMERQVCVRAGEQGAAERLDLRFGQPVRPGLNAINCARGDPLAREQKRAANKDAVLDVLGKVGQPVRTSWESRSAPSANTICRLRRPPRRRSRR